ncbi:beta-lactamase family protein [Streptomyces prunicolor]|uniref:serine hydrolase domain-containing protein n=1 Tax=Streptomyces prunicolor TaxID=67348 RepID=UPI00224FDE84|nr:serine hydrolase domain-containing protein [Streptomyces prunicolor]MCX5240057.1 beta-lactamase family protein [Streptomyces prunicolor]
MDVQGRTAPGFEKVAEVFAANFARYGEVGAAFAAYRDGEPVVDLWAGVTDPGTGRPWQADTLQLVFSGAKGLTSACVLLLVERGLLELDAPAARYWPEFAAAGKERITVGEILSHQARLPGVQQPVDTEELLNPEHMATLLAAQAPTTDPRAAFIYHALTWGWLTGELVRRVDGRTVGALFADEFAGPLGLDTWLGLPDTEHHRVATTIAGPGVLRPKDEDEDEERDALQVLTRNPLLTPDAPALWNSAAFRRAQLPAVGAHVTARSMARFYTCLARGGELDGVRVLDEATVRLGRRELRRGVSPLWGTPMAYGAGFELRTELGLFGPPPDAFGHAGAGGSRHGAWPGERVGFSYTMNLTRAEFPDRRPLDLLASLHEAALAFPR